MQMCRAFFVNCRRLASDYAIILGRIMPSSRDGTDYGIIRTGIMPLSASVVSCWKAHVEVGIMRCEAKQRFIFSVARVCRNALCLLIRSTISGTAATIDSCLKLFRTHVSPEMPWRKEFGKQPNDDDRPNLVAGLHFYQLEMLKMVKILAEKEGNQ